MIDPALERNYSDCTELLELWRRFHDIMAQCVKGDAVTNEGEEDFLNVKSRIAMLHDSFMAAIMADKNIAQSMLTIVSRAITLHHLARMSVAEVKKMEIEWHQAFLLLQETLGNLEEKRQELSEISEAVYRAEQFRHRTKQRIDRVLKSNVTKGLIILMGLIFVTVGVQVLGIWDWSKLKDYPATRNAFYYTYDIGLRFFFPHIKYYRLDWVGFAVPPEETRGFLPGDFWEHDPTADNRRDISDTLVVEDRLVNLGVFDQSLIDRLEAREEYKQLWANNSQDYICLALFMMDSRTEASALTDEVRRAVEDTRAGHYVGAFYRSNILVVVWLEPYGSNNPTQAGQDAFSEFCVRGRDLIK
ncbi:hypothetical protein JXA47_16920 [Candidatus Sumerlaeota bacterium]|nr:hypothetical protein [Candidatus Sumerlaeota bacterium]